MRSLPIVTTAQTSSQRLSHIVSSKAEIPPQAVGSRPRPSLPTRCLAPCSVSSASPFSVGACFSVSCLQVVSSMQVCLPPLLDLGFLQWASIVSARAASTSPVSQVTSHLPLGTHASSMPNPHGSCGASGIGTRPEPGKSEPQ